MIVIMIFFKGFKVLIIFGMFCASEVLFSFTLFTEESGLILCSSALCLTCCSVLPPALSSSWNRVENRALRFY